MAKADLQIRTTGDHTTVQPIVVARGKGPSEMKDKFDTQEIVKLYTGEQVLLFSQGKGVLIPTEQSLPISFASGWSEAHAKRGGPLIPP